MVSMSCNTKSIENLLVCRDLRTNLPREIMGYTDVPFTPTFMGAASRDPRRYPGHAEVGLEMPRERA